MGVLYTLVTVQSRKLLSLLYGFLRFYRKIIQVHFSASWCFVKIKFCTQSQNEINHRQNVLFFM